MCATKAYRFLSYLLLSALISSVAGQQASDNQPSPYTATATVTVAVTDHNHRVVTGLKAEHFTLYEDGQPQPISSVTFGDVPACIGLLADRSGSMRKYVSATNTALMDFARASNPEDQFFVVNFSDEPYLDQDFTRDPGLIKEGLAHGQARGGTTLYDSVIAAATHLAERRDCNRRILVILSDGTDNASGAKLPGVIAAVQNYGNPAIYALRLPDDQPNSDQRGRRTLETLASATGGAVFSVKNTGDTGRVAEIIRNQYSVSYVPAHPQTSGAPTIAVAASSPEHKDLIVSANVATKINLTVASAAQIPAVPYTPPQPRTSCISGSVVDDYDQPVAGLSLQAWPRFSTDSYPRGPYPSAISDENGKFKIVGLVAGLYNLFTQNESGGYPSTINRLYQDRPVPRAQASETCADVVVRMGPKAAKLKIKVVDASTQAPVTNFGVSVANYSQDSLKVPEANPGQEIPVPAGADITIEVWSPRYLNSQPMVVKAPGPTASQEVTVALEPGDNATRKAPER